MDVNGDSHLDVLSGSYSEHDPFMAGVFQVLRGDGKGSFARPQPLRGTDGEPLIITPMGDAQDADIERICTRPFAADLNGDGTLDIVSGNFGGTFAFFAGQGDGKFTAKSTWLKREGERLQVSAHSDPFLVDWDGDGDLDLLSGSAQGGAFLFPNIGTRTEPAWGRRQPLLEASPRNSSLDDEPTFGDAHIKGPQSDTRVWASDVDGDGKLDLLLGDSVHLTYPAKGLDEATAKKRLTAWNDQLQKLMKARDPDNSDAMDKLWEEREKILREESTGHVWLLRQK